MLFQPRSSVRYTSILWDELQPYPGRLDLSLRMALVTTLVAVTAMALQVPEAAISCYLVFFAFRADAGSGILIAIGLLVGATIGILLAIVCLMVVADEPALRLALVAFFTFGGMYLTQASRAGPPIGTVAMVFAFVMTLYDIVPIPELLIRGLAWMWVVVFFPVVYLVAIHVIAGHSPARKLRSAIAERLEVAGRLLAGGDDAAKPVAAALLAKGNGELKKYAGFAKLLALMGKRDVARMKAATDASYDLLTLALALSLDERRPRENAAAEEVLRRIAEAIRRHKPPEQGLLGSPDFRAFKAADPLPVRQVERIVDILAGVDQPALASGAVEEGFFLPDAFSNPLYTQFALKALLAVMITYITYTALDWFAIHTALITCFMVALGTTGETMHKLALRLTGCLLGGAVAIGSTIWLVPHMTDIGQLAFLVGTVSLIAAWISVGSERISYIGWQMALCFFLVVLHGFGPSLDLNEARDRIIGIIFGNIVVSVVFSTIWPVSIGQGIRKGLAASGAMLADLLARRGGRTGDYAELISGLAGALRRSELLRFEPANVRRGDIDAWTTECIALGLQELAAPIVELREHDRAFGPLRGASAPLKRAVVGYERTVAQWLNDQAERLEVWPPTKPNSDLSLALRRLKARLARARQASDDARGFPRRIRDELAWRLELYEKIETVVRRLAAGDTLE
ncbi:FUSC family protein [Ensifer sp. ZNC0028]|uniref:FUSC family protein n=1 Tax=Ensifer sp. ZNC0028 TaxID=1339236 RepID=UPI00068E183E|nr:FUSC family protein [Ensifer sp. ZNC0028]